MKRFKLSPIITGEDAKRFYEEINRERTPEEIERIKRTVKMIKEIFEKHGLPKIGGNTV